MSIPVTAKTSPSGVHGNNQTSYEPLRFPLLLVFVLPPEEALRPWFEVLPVSPFRSLLVLLTCFLFALFCAIVLVKICFVY